MISRRRALVMIACLTTFALSSDGNAQTGAKKSDSVVKVTASADKPDAEGKQSVKITLAIDKGWHAYANPVGLSDLADVQTTVAITAKTKPDAVKVTYPAGKQIKDKIVGDYNVYEDKAVIKAVVQRPKGDAGPLEVTVKLQACSDQKCLLPATVKLTVP